MNQKKIVTKISKALQRSVLEERSLAFSSVLRTQSAHISVAAAWGFLATSPLAIRAATDRTPVFSKSSA